MVLTQKICSQNVEKKLKDKGKKGRPVVRVFVCVGRETYVRERHRTFTKDVFTRLLS